MSDDEYRLVKQLNSFADAVKSAADKNEPFYINRYVTNLAKDFNKFYNTNPILKADVPEETKKRVLRLPLPLVPLLKRLWDFSELILWKVCNN